MKYIKIISIVLYMLITASYKANGQIIFEAQVDSLDYDRGFKIIRLNNSETKYYKMDTIANTFHLLNMDFTPFLTNVSVPEPFNSANYGYHVLYITTTLFDCDSTNIEYVYTAPLDNTKPFRVMRTDGTVLFSRDSINAGYCFGCMGGSDEVRPITNTSAGAKLLLTTGRLGYPQIYIYSLCGILPMGDKTPLTQDLDLQLIKAYPNPSNEEIHFEINLPKSSVMQYYDFVILNESGSIIKQQKIMENQLYTINVHNYANGNYYYSLINDTKMLYNGKFIIQK